MRPIERVPLSQRTRNFLTKRTESVLRHENPKARCEQLWKSNDNKPFREIKESLCEMSYGRIRCMYCEDNEAAAIDHFWPKSVYPERGFSWENYFFACTHCNSNYKRNQFPLDDNGSPFIVNPVDDDPTEHFILSFSTGRFVGLTSRAEESVRVFGLDRQTLVDGRRNTFHAIKALLKQYDSMDRNASRDELYGTVTALAQTSFSSVLFFLRRAVNQPNPEIILSSEVIAILRRNEDFLAIVS